MKTTPTRRKRKTTNSSSLFRHLHPFFPARHPILVPLSARSVAPIAVRSYFAIAVLLFAAASAAPSFAQDPPKKMSAAQQSCLLYGNVFTAAGNLLPDADVHVRRATDKHPKWEASSDRRGEFAVRVPPGADYVIEVKAKGYVTQSKTVTAQAYSRLDLVFHMDPSPEKKK